MFTRMQICLGVLAVAAVPVVFATQQAPTMCPDSSSVDDLPCHCLQGLGDEVDDLTPPACFDHVTWTLTNDTNGCCHEVPEGCDGDAHNCQGIVTVDAYAKNGQSCAFEVWRGSNTTNPVCSGTVNHLTCHVRFLDANGNSLSCGTEEDIAVKIGSDTVAHRPFVCNNCNG